MRYCWLEEAEEEADQEAFLVEGHQAEVVDMVAVDAHLQEDIQEAEEEEDSSFLEEVVFNP